MIQLGMLHTEQHGMYTLNRSRPKSFLPPLTKGRARGGEGGGWYLVNVLVAQMEANETSVLR